MKRGRLFFIANPNGCLDTTHWIRINDVANISHGCDFDNVPSVPRFFYSAIGGEQNASGNL